MGIRSPRTRSRVLAGSVFVVACALPIVSGAATPTSTEAPKTPKAIAAPTATAAKPGELHFDVVRTKLDNGLRVVMLVDHASPTVAVDVVYDVGSRNETQGRSGFAHLFEHMMFQGSKNVPRGEHLKLVTNHGGTLNGTTNEDRTNYFELLPSSELALGLWLEADRMKSLDVSQSNFENQRAVVKEEYRMSVGNAAYVPAMLKLQELVYEGYWPYEHSPIGTMNDLDGAKFDWVRAFHDAYYAPNNAVLSIAGDFDPELAMALVRQYFGPAQAQPNVPPFTPPALAPQTKERSAVVDDPHAKLAAIFEGWAIPKSGEPDHYALTLAGLLLAGGESSRLHRALVREQNLAIETDARTSGLRGPDMFEIDVKLAGGADVAKVRKLVETQIADLARLGPTDADMTKVRNSIRAHFLFGLQSNFARAQRLAEMELYRGDANLLNEELARYLAVSKADIKRVVGTYLTPARRSVVEVRPSASPEQPATTQKTAPPTAPKTTPKSATPSAQGDKK